MKWSNTAVRNHTRHKSLTHCILNRLSHTIYWKRPISILGTSGYEILHIPREKWLNYLQTVETLIRCRVLRRLIWVCTVCQLPFYGSPNYNGLSTLCEIYIYRRGESSVFVGSCNGTSGGFEALQSFQLCFTYDLIRVEMGNITKTCLYNFDPINPTFM